MPRTKSGRGRGRAASGEPHETDAQRVAREAHAAAAAVSERGGITQPTDAFNAEDDPFVDAPDGVVYDVYRVDDVKKKPVYQFRLERADIEDGLDRALKERRGGGTYDVREKFNDPDTGKPKWGRSRRRYVEGPSKPLALAPSPVPELGTLGPDGHPANDGMPVTAVGVDRLNDLFQQRIFKLVETQDAMMAGVIERLKGDGKGGEVPKLMELMLPFLGPVIAAALERLVAPPLPSSPVAAAAPGMKELLGTLNELRQFQRSLEPRAPREDRDDGDFVSTGNPGLDTVREFLPLLKDVFSQAKREDAARAGQRTLPAAGSRPVDVKQLLAPQVPGLVKLAVEGKNAQAYGAVVADRLPAMFRKSVVAFLGRPGWWQEFATAFPTAAPHQQWFTVFAGSMLASLGGAAEAGTGSIPVDTAPVSSGDVEEPEPPTGGV